MTEKDDQKTEIPSPPKPRSRPASPGFDFTTPPNVPSELPDDDPSTPPQKRPETPVLPPAPTTLRRSTRQVRPVIPYIAGTSGLDEFQAQLESVYTEGDELNEFDETTDFEPNGNPDEIYTNHVALYAASAAHGEPHTFKEAMNGDESSEWFAAMMEEYDSLKQMKVWKVVPRPTNRKVVGCKWVFKKKIGVDGTVVRSLVVVSSY